MKYKHLKSGRIYDVLSMNIINATNKDDGTIMVLYQGMRKEGSGVMQFVREINEFNEKFEIIPTEVQKKAIKPKRKIVKFFYICGHECLKDGTQKETASDLKGVQEILDDWEVEYDETITDYLELAKSVEEAWAENFNDGGGSGWMEGY